MKRALVLTLALAACKSSVDFNAGRGYACDRDAGSAEDFDQCGLGYRCGLEGLCHAEGQPAAYACHTAADCEASWVCGLTGTCHDPNDAEAWECNTNGDCTVGWVCGLELKCHSATDVEAWLCNDDSQCAGNWRCGLDGRCLDPSSDALGPRDDPGQNAVLLAPLIIPQGTANGLVSAWPNGFFIDFQWGDGLFTLVPSTNALIHDSDVVEPYVGTSNVYGAFAVVDGGVAYYRDAAPDAGWQPLLDSAGQPLGFGIALRSTNSDGVLVLQNDDAGDATVRWALYGGNNPASDAIALDVGPVFDALIAEHSTSDSCMFAATPLGLSLANVDAGSWSAFSVGSVTASACTSLFNTTYEDIALKVRNDANKPRLAIRFTPERSEVQQVALEDMTEWASVTDAGSCPFEVVTGLMFHTCTASHITELFSCAPCDPTTELATDFAIVAGQDALAVRCEGGPLGPREIVVNGLAVDGYTCATVPFTPVANLAGPLANDARALASDGWARSGPHGQLWVGQSPVDAFTMFLDRPALGLVTQDSTNTPDASVTIAVAGAHYATFSSLGALDSIGPVAASVVSGDGELLVLASGAVTRRGHVVAIVDAPEGTFKAPVHATIAPRSDGGTELWVSTFDSIYSVATPPAGTVAPASLELRVIPSPGSEILSLAADDETASDAGNFMGGWVQTQNAVFRLTASSQTRWKPGAVTVPDGEVVRVWTEGAAGRVGYRDGTVVSLPSRVVIGAPLATGRVSDYLGACHMSYAVADTGLYRLEPQDGGVGTWQRETVTDVDPYTFSSDALANAKLALYEDQLYLFTSYGGVLQFVPRGGCD